MMLEKLSYHLTDLVCTESYNNPEDRAKIQYGLSIFLSEGFKFVSLFLLFNIVKRQNYFYFSLLILLTIRVFSGGIHIKGSLNCLLLTILFFVLTTCIAAMLPRLHGIFYLSVSIISAVIVFLRAPACSVKRPIRDNTKRLQYKITATSFTILWSIILVCLINPAYINCGFSTILLQNLQLLFIKGRSVNNVNQF